MLVADDSPVNREVVTEALTRLKARTHTVEDGAQAVEAFKTGRFDIVLMDCSMPEMDGFAATRAIRAFEQEARPARTPVVALTAHVAGSAADSWQRRRHGRLPDKALHDAEPRRVSCSAGSPAHRDP